MKSYKTFILIIAVALALFSGFALYQNVTPSVLLQENERVIEIANRDVTVVVADSMIERQRGLSGKVTLEEDTGMFFIFPEEGTHGIWMKDMNFPIDIIWLDEELRIVHIEEKVVPETYPEVFTSDEDALYVVELMSGFVEQYAVHEGDFTVLK